MIGNIPYSQDSGGVGVNTLHERYRGDEEVAYTLLKNI